MNTGNNVDRLAGMDHDGRVPVAVSSGNVPASLVVHDAQKSYGSVQALRRVSCRLHGNQVVGLIGANGSGKTTLVRALLGLHRLDHGSIRVAGHPPGSLPARRKVGAMLQDAAPPDALQVAELVGLFGGYYQDPLPLAEVLRMADLAALGKRRYGNLSGGERRRVQFALAIVGDPSIVILDEPTVHMDSESRTVFRNVVRDLRKRGKLIVLVSHDMADVEALADRVLVMHDGELVADDTVETIREMFGISRVVCRTKLDENAISRMENLISWKRDGRRVTLLTRSPDQVLRALLHVDPDASEMTMEVAPLEDAITAMVERFKEKEY